ncbi:MAG: lambda exonuclease family protein [Patescibacteria group bacterium]
MRKHRLTASNFSCVIRGRGYRSPEKLREDMLKCEKIEINGAMQHGIDNEDNARKFYEETTGNKVVEVGLCIPLWDKRIGGSPDGLVGDDGCIEIKCPKRMYPKLTIEPFNMANITPSHFDQMQGCMAILGRKWCDYVVYATESENVFIERVPFDEKYWNETLYFAIKDFLDKTTGLEPFDIEIATPKI